MGTSKPGSFSLVCLPLCCCPPRGWTPNTPTEVLRAWTVKLEIQVLLLGGGFFAASPGLLHAAAREGVSASRIKEARLRFPADCLCLVQPPSSPATTASQTVKPETSSALQGSDSQPPGCWWQGALLLAVAISRLRATPGPRTPGFSVLSCIPSVFLSSLYLFCLSHSPLLLFLLFSSTVPLLPHTPPSLLSLGPLSSRSLVPHLDAH